MANADQPAVDAYLVGGPEHREILLVPYDPGWPARFDAERQRIEAATC